MTTGNTTDVGSATRLQMDEIGTEEVSTAGHGNIGSQPDTTRTSSGGNGIEASVPVTSSTTLSSAPSGRAPSQMPTPSGTGFSRSNIPSSPRRASASNTPRAARRDTSGSINAGASASSYLSNQTSSASAAPMSMFGFLGGPRPTSESAPAEPLYGWRSTISVAQAMRGSSAEGPNRPSSFISERYRNNNVNQQSRPAIGSFMGDLTDADYGWNPSRNRNNANGGATVAALQQQHQHNNHQQSQSTGSPARRHAAVNGTSSPWLSAMQGNGGYHHHTMASSSGWTLADPAAWSGWSMNNDKACSSFEENQIVAFTWSIPEASLLREEVETTPLPSEGARSVSAGAGKSEVWTTQPIFGDGKWKLELVRTRRSVTNKEADRQRDSTSGGDSEEDETSTTVLSVYITSMVLDYSPADMEIPATIMIGIKPVQSQTRSSRSQAWVWREFVNYNFRRENEYYECHNLPSLSDLLRDSEIKRHDAFSLTIQISTGPRAAFKAVDQGIGSTGESAHSSPFVVKDNHLVHHSLINGLERLLDCQRTGDVILIARERGILRSTEDDEQGTIWPLPVGMPMYDWAQLDPEKDHHTPIMVRDRCLWAHSSILCARSEFFNDMLQSNFAEGREQQLPSGDISSEAHLGGRKVKTLRIDNADFTTLYWLLRYLYLEEVEFAATEDVHCAALDDDWMTIGLPSHSELGKKALWQWTALTHLECLSEGSSSIGNQGSLVRQQNVSSVQALSGGLQNGNASSKMPSQVVPSIHSIPNSPDRPRLRSPQQVYNSNPRRSTSDHSRRRRSVEVTNAYPGSIETDRFFLYQHLHQDPEEHPCAKASLASALALYKLAHRFDQGELLQLTKMHLINTLNPHSAFQVLLASYLYTDLYNHVKAYVLDKWNEVSNTREFEQCCDEVSAGEWGYEAGRALRVFMQSLTSPNRAR